MYVQSGTVDPEVLNISKCTVESLNEGHFRTASVVLCKEVVLFGRFNMYWNLKEKIRMLDLKLCPS